MVDLIMRVLRSRFGKDMPIKDEHVETVMSEGGFYLSKVFYAIFAFMMILVLLNTAMMSVGLAVVAWVVPFPLKDYPEFTQAHLFYISAGLALASLFIFKLMRWAWRKVLKEKEQELKLKI